MNAQDIKLAAQEVKSGQHIKVAVRGNVLLNSTYPELTAQGIDTEQKLRQLITQHQGQHMKVWLNAQLRWDFRANPALLHLPETRQSINGLEPAPPPVPNPAPPKATTMPTGPVRPPEDVNSFKADFYQFQYQNAFTEIDRLRHENMQLHSDNIGLLREKATWEGKREIEVLLARNEGKKGLSGLTDPGVLEGLGALLEKAAIALATIKEKDKSDGKGSIEGMDGTAATYATQIMEELRGWTPEDIYKLAYLTEYFSGNKRALESIFQKVQNKVTQGNNPIIS